LCPAAVCLFGSFLSVLVLGSQSLGYAATTCWKPAATFVPAAAMLFCGAGQ